MNHDLIFVDCEEATRLQGILFDLKKTIPHLGTARITEIKIGDEIMDCAVFSPNGWNNECKDNAVVAKETV